MRVLRGPKTERDAFGPRVRCTILPTQRYQLATVVATVVSSLLHPPPSPPCPFCFHTPPLLLHSQGPSETTRGTGERAPAQQIGKGPPAAFSRSRGPPPSPIDLHLTRGFCKGLIRGIGVTRLLFCSQQLFEPPEGGPPPHGGVVRTGPQPSPQVLRPGTVTFPSPR